MGIKNLHKLLKDLAPNCYHTRHLSQFAFQKIAIDISLYMFKYKTIMGDDWLKAFVNLVGCLRKNEIHCVFIYDNGSPVEKSKEKEERQAQRQKLLDKTNQLEKDIKNYLQLGEISELLRDINNKYQKEDKVRRLLSKMTDNNLNFNIKYAQEEYEKIKNQSISITKQDFNLSRELFDILKVPYFNAILEAEKTCVHLQKDGLVDGVLSEDTDVLAYGVKHFLTKINTGDDTCVYINIDEVLQTLELSYEQFLDVCIMCGTDYNNNIPKIGPKNAYKLIKEYGSIEGIKDGKNIDVSILNHVRVRELFSFENKLEWNIPYCEPPEWNNVQQFLFHNNCNVNLEYIKKCFAPKELVFIEDEE